MIKTTQLKGNKLVDRLKQLSKPMNEVVSTNDEIDLDEILQELGIFESDNETLRPGLRSQTGPGRPPPELDRAAVIKLFARGVRGKMKDMR